MRTNKHNIILLYKNSCECETNEQEIYMILFTMPYLKPLVLFCLSAGCYARNVVPKHNNKNFDSNNIEHVQTFYKRMEAEKTELDNSRPLQKSHDHPPIMVNNVTVSLSSISVHQGGAIDISFTTTNGEFPSYDDYLMIVNDDVVFNTTDYYDWSAPDSNAMRLADLEKYNPATMEYELLYDNTTGVLSSFILPYYPSKLKAILFTPGYGSFRSANYILGESQVFETIDSDMTIVATQKDRQVTFNVSATAPITSRYYNYVIILDSETVPDRMDWDTAFSWKPVYNYTYFPEDSDGQTVAAFSGSDKLWPKGDYKMIAFVEGLSFGGSLYHVAVSNTISVNSTVCKQNKGKCKDIWDCCGGAYGNLECKKIKFGLFGLRTRKQCAISYFD